MERYFLQLIYESIRDIFMKNICVRLTAEEEGPRFEKELKILTTPKKNLFYKSKSSLLMLIMI